MDHDVSVNAVYSVHSPKKNRHRRKKLKITLDCGNQQLVLWSSLYLRSHINPYGAMRGIHVSATPGSVSRDVV
jgi:hypothetical protein